MQLTLLTTLAVYASSASAVITWNLAKNPNPSADEADAYSRIEAAMNLAATRYNQITNANKNINVQYVPGVPTADANWNGSLRFGSDRAYMNERTALHEISHTLGIGQRQAFNDRCANNDWPSATPLLQSWDGSGARINCGGGHIWPYGLNYDNEFSETSAQRHCQLIQAMINDGMQAY